VAFLPLFARSVTILVLISISSPCVTILANGRLASTPFVSESLRRGTGFLSIPAGMAVLACVGLVVASVPRNARRFLLYAPFDCGHGCVRNFAPQTLTSCFTLDPLPVGSRREDKSFQTRIRAASHAIDDWGIGMFGSLFAALLFRASILEPWPQVRWGAAGSPAGATVIANTLLFPLLDVYLQRRREHTVKS